MLPDFDKLPSVMNRDELSVYLFEIMEIAETNDQISIIEIAECLCDGFFALGYDPDGRFAPTLSKRMFDWVIKNWERGDDDFIDGATAILANIDCEGIDEFLIDKVNTEERILPRQYAEEVLKERRDFYGKS